MGFDNESHASWAYWLDKTKVSGERNVKFDVDTTEVMGIPATQPTDMRTDPFTDTARTNVNDTTPAQSMPKQPDQHMDSPRSAYV